MRFLALVFFVFAAAAVARLAFAGYLYRLDSPATVARAMDTVHSAEYALRLAELDPDHAPAALRRAIVWNPQSSGARIALGLDEERSGDLAAAARDLLAAADVDRQYLPAWTLANFYFRRGDRDRFHQWARRSAELIPGDFQPLLALCDRVDPGSATSWLPADKKFDRAYLDLLIAGQRWNDARRIALRLNDPKDFGRLAAFTTLLLDAREHSIALELRSILLPQSPSLANGDFHAAPTNQAFDWRVPSIAGIDARWIPGRLTLFFSGREPETCAILAQPLALDAGVYTLRFDYSGPPGLRWTIDATETAGLQPAPAWTHAQRRFSVARGGVQWLRLIYRRDPGTTRADGSFELSNVALEKGNTS